MRRTDALIIGGGPAGSAAGIRLASQGANVRLFERSTGPRDVVCGGFLSWDSIRLLKGLGIDPDDLGAPAINVLRLVSTERTVELRLPHPAAGLSRRCLDEVLLARAAEAGVAVIRGKSVRGIDLEARAISLEEGDETSAEALFLATGKHELRGAARLPASARKEAAVGLRIALRPSSSLQRALLRTLELHLFDGGYAGLLTQEDGSVTLCLSVSKGRLSDAGGLERMLERLALGQAYFGERLAEDRAGDWVTIAGVPYGWRAHQGSPGIFRLGDQAAVIASLAGDGIAIALRSGIDAAGAFLAGGPDRAPGFQARFARDAAPPLKVAGFLRFAAENRTARGPLMALVNTVPGLARAAARLTRVG